MLRKAKDLHGDAVRALDGDIGTVDEFLFDDELWTIRYLIADTGSWFLGHKVLIAPRSLGQLDWNRHALNVNLTRDQVERSPGVSTNAPVSRQLESEYYDYYAWPYYWGDMGGVSLSGGMSLYQTSLIEPITGAASVAQPVRASGDAHLRSSKEVTGYGISAEDGHLGHVEDFIVDDETWRICYLAVDTRDWWPGKKILLPTKRIGQTLWPDRIVKVELSRDQVRNAPEWNANEPISREFEDELAIYFADRQRDAPLESAGQPGVFPSTRHPVGGAV